MVMEKVFGFMLFFLSPPCWAEKTPSKGQMFWDQMLLIGGIFFIFYFLVLRPQAKKTKQQYKFINELKKGDEVITTSGIFARVMGVTPQYVILRIDENVNIRMLKTQIMGPAKEMVKKKKSS